MFLFDSELSLKATEIFFVNHHNNHYGPHCAKQQIFLRHSKHPLNPWKLMEQQEKFSKLPDGYGSFCNHLESFERHWELQESLWQDKTLSVTNRHTDKEANPCNELRYAQLLTFINKYGCIQELRSTFGYFKSFKTLG